MKFLTALETTNATTWGYTALVNILAIFWDNEI